MALPIQRLGARRFSDEKMQKVALFETPRFFCDIYCLEPGQAQKPHRHDGSDKLYAVLEGRARVTVGDESAELAPGDAVLCPAGAEHSLENAGAERAAVLVFMAPPPAH
jgi:mannose-6-phosphate isomerase-like protein (cupin superfamily)